MKKGNVKLICGKAQWKTFLDTLEREIGLAFWHWLHSGPEEMGKWGCSHCSGWRKSSKRALLPGLCKALCGWYSSSGHPTWLCCLKWHRLKGPEADMRRPPPRSGLLLAQREPLCKWRQASTYKKVFLPGSTRHTAGWAEWWKSFRPRVDPTERSLLHRAQHKHNHMWTTEMGICLDKGLVFMHLQPVEQNLYLPTPFICNLKKKKVHPLKSYACPTFQAFLRNSFFEPFFSACTYPCCPSSLNLL